MIPPSRPTMRPPVIVATCTRCNDVIYAGDVSVRNRLGLLDHARCTSGTRPRGRQPNPANLEDGDEWHGSD